MDKSSEAGEQAERFFVGPPPPATPNLVPGPGYKGPATPNSNNRAAAAAANQAAPPLPSYPLHININSANANNADVSIYIQDTVGGGPPVPFNPAAADKPQDYATAKAWAEATSKRDHKHIYDEYKAVVEDPVYRGISYDAWKKAAEGTKRHALMPCWDRTRVALTLPEDKARRADFIHANWVTGPISQREFIATQGPLPTTIGDFWAMVWQEKVAIILMLCRCTETDPGKGSREKSAQYWKLKKGETLSLRPARPMDVETKEVEMLGDDGLRGVSVRLTTLALRRDERERPVFHYHVLNWPDMSLPQHPLGIFALHRILKDKERELGVTKQLAVATGVPPILVHCSAGVGRSGTFIALIRAHFALLGPRPDLHVDFKVKDLVTSLRKDRHFAVQTDQQYLYIYQALMSALKDKGVISSELPVPYDPKGGPPPGVALGNPGIRIKNALEGKVDAGTGKAPPKKATPAKDIFKNIPKPPKKTKK